MEFVEWPASHAGMKRDRVLFYWSQAWEDWCVGNMDRSDANISKHRPFGIATAEAGWREYRPFWSVQIIRHCVLGDGDALYGEADVDVGNPICGLIPAAVHGLEWAWHRLPKIFGGRKKFTGPFMVAAEFRRRGWNIRDMREVEV